MQQSFKLWICWLSQYFKRTFVWFFRFLESFYLRQKTLDFKLKTKITGVLRKKRCILQKPQKSKYGCFIFAFSFSWQLLRYMINILNIWTDSLWKCQMFLDKISSKSWEMPQVLPRNIQSRYNHESLVSGSVKLYILGSTWKTRNLHGGSHFSFLQKKFDKSFGLASVFFQTWWYAFYPDLFLCNCFQ